jgi:hypothetical protein
MKQLTPVRGVAVLTLAIALAPGAASAQEDGTITISGTFSPLWLGGTVGPDLAEVYANGHEHTWTLTLDGTSQGYFYWDGFTTRIYATSFDLEFFGPDAATLNGIVSEYIAGGDVLIDLSNFYWGDLGNFASIRVIVWSPDVVFGAGGFEEKSDTLFPSDAYGYPVVGPEPFSIWAETSHLEDNRPGNDGWIVSLENLVTIEGSVGEPDPEEPVVLAVSDASVWEGNNGWSQVAVAVTLSSGSSQAITVSYRTVDGTAKAKEDYTATSGTLTFQPGETSRTISVSIKGDRKREADENFFVQLSNAVGATIGDGSATVTILNDD